MENELRAEILKYFVGLRKRLMEGMKDDAESAA